MNILDSIIPEGMIFYRKRSIIFSKSRRDDIITNQEKNVSAQKTGTNRWNNHFTHSGFLFLLLNIFYNNDNLRVYFDKNRVGFSSSKKV